MKKIAITQRIMENKDYYEMRDCLDTNWARLLNELDSIPIILPTLFNFRDYFNIMDISGVIFTGGNDLYSVNKEEVNIIRDEFEKSLLEFCIEKSIPVIGVCRGMQVIGEFFCSEFVEVEGHIATKHDILIKDNTTLSRFSKYKNRVVNSYHRYSLKKLPKEFILCGETSEGDIEAFEHKTHRIFGQMWHPERGLYFNEDDKNFMKNYFR